MCNKFVEKKGGWEKKIYGHLQYTYMYIHLYMLNNYKLTSIKFFFFCIHLTYEKTLSNNTQYFITPSWVIIQYFITPSKNKKKLNSL
jgi:hypothetical protein